LRFYGGNELNTVHISLHWSDSSIVKRSKCVCVRPTLCVHPLVALLNKCQTIAFLYIFNKLLYIFLLYMSRLSLSFFQMDNHTYVENIAMYIHTSSLICNFSPSWSLSEYINKGQTFRISAILMVIIITHKKLKHR
jgi:hypothetical protein